MTQIKVVLSGFSTSETTKFQQIFRFSQSRDQNYSLTDTAPDIILVNTFDQNALSKSIAYTTQHPITRLVTVGRTAPENRSTYHITPPYITSRVLRTLDKIKIDTNQTAKKERNASTTETDKKNSEGQYNVLVVDDSPSMQKMLEIELSQIELNINIDFADTGEEALEKTENKHYDFIFLDIMMPGIDGYEVCKTIRKNPDEKKTPIIMLSGKTSPLDEVKGVIAGCTTYLTKPIEHIEFQGVIKRIIEWLDHKRPVPQVEKREVEHC